MTAQWRMQLTGPAAAWITASSPTSIDERQF
jgi:hypothetical protein